MNYKNYQNMLISKSGVNASQRGGSTTLSTTNRTRSSNVATLTFGSSHSFSVGNWVVISGLGGSGYNGYWPIKDIPSGNQISYDCSGTNEGTTADTGGSVADTKTRLWTRISNSMSLEEAQSLIDKHAFSGHFEQYIQFENGTYNWAGPLRIRSRNTGGNLIISGNPTETASTRYTSQAVHLNFSSSSGILIESCQQVQVFRMKVTFISDTEEGYGLRLLNCQKVLIHSSFITGTSSNYGSCVQAEKSFVYGYYTVVSNARYGWHAKQAAYLGTVQCGTTTPNLGTAWRVENISQISGGSTSATTNYTTRNSDGNYFPQWKPSTVYSLGDFVSRQIPAGFKYECTRAGTSGGSEPAFPNSNGATVNDPDGSGAQWTARTDVSYVPTSIWGTFGVYGTW